MTPKPAVAPEASREEAARRALAAGDADGALTELMRLYGTPIYRYCLQMIGEPSLAEEVHQITFVQAYEGLRQFDGRSSLRTWLMSIARHRCLDGLKVARRRERRFPLHEVLPEVPVEPADPVSGLDRRSLATRVRACLATLAPQVRSLVLLRFQEEMPYEAIAALAAERPGTLRVRLARALPVLRRCLEAPGGRR